VRLTVRAAAGTVAAAIAFGACGSSGDGVSTAARDRLSPIIGQIRKRAAAHDAAGAERALANLRQNVARFEQNGAIGEADAAAILQAARAVENRLTLITTTTTTTLPPEPPERPERPEPHDRDEGKGKDKDGDKDRDHGRGRGRGKGNDDDRDD
jgi:hypothetical protein